MTIYVKSKFSWRNFCFSLILFCFIKTLNCYEQSKVSAINSAESEAYLASSIDDFDFSGDEENDETKFSWKHHQEDHGIYANKELMSTDNIKHEEPREDENIYITELNSKLKSNSASRDEELDGLKTIDYPEKEWQLMFRAFDLAIDGISSSVLQQIGSRTNFFEDIINRLEPDCKRDIEHTRNSLKKHKLWALRMVDSNGKIPSGVTYGRFSSPGDYEECLSVRVDEKIYQAPKTSSSSQSQSNDNQMEPQHFKFHGKYCLIDFRLPLPERPKDKLLSIHDPILNLTGTALGDQFPELKNYSAYASVFYEVGYMHGLCLPSSCKVTDLTKSIGISLSGLHIIVNNTVDCEERFDEPKPLRTSQIISLTLLGLLFLNVAGATIAHHYQSKERKRLFRLSQRLSAAEREKIEDIHKHQQGSRGANIISEAFRGIKQSRFYADCFSVQSNFGRLSKPDPRGLTFVHYTRIVAMGLTVITHTAGMGTLQAITKPADASNSEQIFRDFLPQMLANAFTSIQIFFFMAGLMLVISTYPSIRRDKGHISFLEYAIKRAIRLMPGIAATICINFIWPLLVDGPMLSYFVRAIVIPCETTWWRTLTFLSNFDHVEKMCLRHSYFSASDYQLHVMAFPLLILLYNQPTIALCIAGVLTVGGFVAQVIMVLTKTLMPFMMVDYIDKEAFFNVVHYIHHPVWNHMSAFFFGFIVGYLVVKQIRVELSPTTTKRIWLTIMPLGIASIFAPYFWNHYKRPIYKWQMVLYVIIDRFILLLTCSWLSYASMVLARPKPKPIAAPIVEKPQSNLPEIVTLQQDKPEKEAGEDSSTPVSPIKIQLINSAMDSTNLTPSSPSGFLPRQRSSPNILALSQNDGGTPRLRPASSSVHLGSESSTIEPLREGVEFKQDNGQPAKDMAVEGKSEQRKSDKSRAPISNVNTLCLILSRLTFQLYLFNMVVLWIDVNHSKYFWFFSYYFIITKAFAIYICSSIMALIFFVTLESPCLTLYIAWVKSRALASANKRKKKREDKDETHLYTDRNRNNNRESSNRHTTMARESPDIQGQPIASAPSRKSPDGSYDGLCMQMSPEPTTVEGSFSKPTFRYIDSSDQTKM